MLIKPVKEQKVADRHRDHDGNDEKTETTAVEKPLDAVNNQPGAGAIAPKEVTINGQVTVSLSLLQMPDMNQKKKTEQFVKFSVTRPVYYNGVMIIRQGAIASGSLTIGSIRTDIKINQVEGVNGKMIPLMSEDEHGRRSDIRVNQNYIAVIKQGTRIGF